MFSLSNSGTVEKKTLSSPLESMRFGVHFLSSTRARILENICFSGSNGWNPASSILHFCGFTSAASEVLGRCFGGWTPRARGDLDHWQNQTWQWQFGDFQMCHGDSRRVVKHIIPSFSPLKHIKTIPHDLPMISWNPPEIPRFVQRQVPVTLANRAAVAAELHHRTGARIILSGADVSRVGSSEAQVPREAEKYPLVMSKWGRLYL